MRLVIIEPRAELGEGIAYSTTDLGHLLNVRAGCLSALPDDPDHFTAWVRQHTMADGQSFLPRAWYGKYLRSLLGPIEHIHARAVQVSPRAAGVQITLSDGTRHTVDRAPTSKNDPCCFAHWLINLTTGCCGRFIPTQVWR
jgi:uncharacterized NAD(P)/FAD-binding protein YdhS